MECLRKLILKERAAAGASKVKDMVHSIEQFSRTTPADEIHRVNISNGNDNRAAETATAAALNVTSVEVEWEKTECKETREAIQQTSKYLAHFGAVAVLSGAIHD